MLRLKIKTKGPKSIFMSEKIYLLCARADYRIDSELCRDPFLSPIILSA